MVFKKYTLRKKVLGILGGMVFLTFPVAATENEKESLDDLLARLTALSFLDRFEGNLEDVMSVLEVERRGVLSAERRGEIADFPVLDVLRARAPTLLEWLRRGNEGAIFNASRWTSSPVRRHHVYESHFYNAVSFHGQNFGSSDPLFYQMALCPLQRLSHITYLDLGDTSFGRNLPTILGPMVNLWMLDLRYNGIGLESRGNYFDLDEAFCKRFTNLKELYIGKGNYLRQEEVDRISCFPSLEVVDLSGLSSPSEGNESLSVLCFGKVPSLKVLKVYTNMFCRKEEIPFTAENIVLLKDQRPSIEIH